MSALWTAAEAAAATGGAAHGDWAATGLSIDTRTLAPGDLFIALKDARDGHDFVTDALAKGAAAALVSRVPEGVAQDAPLLIVPDVLAGLEALGRTGRARTRARVLAITGSVGKTSTKEMARAALSGQGRVHAAEASYNNHWGVPLTLARMPRDSDFAVIEIGMNHPGEIAPLARLARPHVAMITTIAAAHMAAFADGLAGIAAEKAALFEGLGNGGTAVIPDGLPTTPILRAGVGAGAARIVTFGSTGDARLLTSEARDGALALTAQIGRAEIAATLATTGRHFAMNAVGVLAACGALGADVAQAARDLGAWRPPAGRGAVEALGSLRLIDDAYNANPTSLSAGLATLAALTGGRRVAILGDMLELGHDEAAQHAAMATDPAMAQVDLVHAAGPRMRHLWDALPESRRGLWAASADDLATRAAELVRDGDIVLVKGSKSSHVSRVVDAIRAARHGARLAQEG